MPIQVSSTEGNVVRQTKTDAGSNPLNGLTLTQALGWIDTNVTDLPSARTAMKQIVKIMYILDKRLDQVEAVLKKAR